MNSSIIVIIFGLPGSGKSYFASRLAYKLNARYINSDRVRKEVLQEGGYTLDQKLAVYEEMLHQLRDAVAQKRNIVMDATFFKTDIRKKFEAEAQKQCPNPFFIEVIAEEPLIEERLRHPRPDSEADFKVYTLLKEQWETMPEPHLTLFSTDDNIADMLRKAEEYLHLDHDQPGHP